MRTRVVIVDDDEWVRRGRACALAEVSEIEIVAAVDHAEAENRPELWAGVDVVLVDAWDPRAEFDRFPGVGVVRAIRAAAPGAPVRVVVVSAHGLNDMLRLRVAAAGADAFYAHDELGDVAALTAAVKGSVPVRVHASRVTAGSGPEAALDWIRDRGVEGAFAVECQSAVPLSRRAIGHIRREVGQRAGIADPGRLAPWRQVVDFVNRARGVELRRGHNPPPPDGRAQGDERPTARSRLGDSGPLAPEG